MKTISGSFTHVIDVSRKPDHRGHDSIPAQLVLICPVENPKEACKAFRAIVSAWLKETPTGKQAWKDSSEDYNYGDLINDQDDPTLLGMLHVAGFVAKVRRLDIGTDIGEDYDSRFSGGD